MNLIPLAVWTPGIGELLIILFIILILFGARKLPELMRNMGRGLKEFKKGIKEEEEEEKSSKDEQRKSGTS